MKRRAFCAGAVGNLGLALHTAQAQVSPSPASPARMPPSSEGSPQYLVAYIEVAPASADTAAKLLRGYRTQTRREHAVKEFEVFHRTEFPYHFAIFTQWTDTKGLQAHNNAGDSRRFRIRLAPHLSAPFDERSLTVLSAGKPVDPRGHLIAITHVDFLPPVLNPGIVSVKELADQSRGVAGNMRYDAFAQVERPNHVFFLEVWGDIEAYRRNLLAKPLVAFRESLLPRLGSLYDERLYKVLV